MVGNRLHFEAGGEAVGSKGFVGFGFHVYGLWLAHWESIDLTILRTMVFAFDMV